MQRPPGTGETIYFAYGANLSRAHMALWCPEAVPLIKAVLPDHRLVFRYWADIVPARGEGAQGALYEVGLRDLGVLDEFEDCPVLYHRIAVTVRTETGPVDAMTYRMNPGHPLTLPDPSYLSLLRKGYEDWGLDAEVLGAMG